MTDTIVHNIYPLNSLKNHFTQGCRWPPNDADTTHRDRLYRNLGNGKFEDVTEQAGLGDHRFSQGIAVGDIDNDGFPDLYVANIGGNRLYRNRGDGTFGEVTGESGIAANAWTTGCLIADLDGDGHPDLYDVNYLTGENVYRKICQKDGVTRACDPGYFEGEQDRIWLNRGEGSFVDRTAKGGIVARDGKGVGIIAADFQGTGRLDLFVANDAVANFWFANETAAPGAPLRFVEQALPSGLAVDADGRTQACMGVAAGDADGDGRLDLFVTNFYRESNTLYRQQAPGVFIDGARRAGLRDPSFSLLGFGTQFLDGELDGRPDLVLTNGHVDDFSHQKQPYRMPPQYFRNLGGRGSRRFRPNRSAPGSRKRTWGADWRAWTGTGMGGKTSSSAISIRQPP